MVLLSFFLQILRKPTIWDVIGELMMFIAPLWLAVILGIFVGWAWKPKWARLGGDILMENSTLNKDSSVPPPPKSFPSGLTFPSLLNSIKFQLPSCVSWLADDGAQMDSCSVPPVSDSDCSSRQAEKENMGLVTEEDLEQLCKLDEVRDGGPAWIQMMDRSTPTMNYQAWRRDPETGPPQYRSRTVFENATPELVRDFFWDDEYRLKWDDMLSHAETLEECPTTGAMVVRWVRKFPFFCSDREYVIGRRIWELGRQYYCVTKGVPYPSLPRQNKPRRVGLYYSSFCVRAVESRSGDGQQSACEVLLFHYEDMGIPWEIAKLGVRQGMWGAVKKFDPALRAYHKGRASGVPLSRSAFMAQVNTKVTPEYMRSLESRTGSTSENEMDDSSEKPSGRNIPKLLAVGGAIALACCLDRGLLTKAVIFGVARRFAKIGGRRL